MAAPPEAGSLIAGKYRLVELLGEGGMGAVWIAENAVLKKRVALKLMGSAIAADVSATDRFLREAVAASRVRHAAIVQIHDAGIDEGMPWIAMELLAGESLGRRLERGPLTLDEIARFLLPILDALAALHDAGIVHRDLKPDNIFLERCADGVVRPKLLDFGIAKQVSVTGLTKTGAIVGTAFYLSPEQARGAKDIDGRADVYAMGVVLFEALSGHMPYEAQSITELIAKMFTEGPRDLSALAPSVAPALVQLVRMCLEREPAARPQSARALHALLTRALGGAADPRALAQTAPSAPPPSMPPLGIATAAPALDFSGLRTTARRFWWVSLVLLLPCCCWCSMVFRSCLAIGGGAASGLGGYQWAATPPLALDVDGHAPTDVVGPIIRIGTGHSVVTIVAIDGGDGSILWESEDLAVSAIAAPLVASDDGSFVALATLEGDTYAWDTRSGGLLASGSVREQPSSVCRAEGGAIAFSFLDGSHARLDSTGRVSALERGECGPLARPMAWFSPTAESASFDLAVEPPSAGGWIHSIEPIPVRIVIPNMHVDTVEVAVDRPTLRVARGWRESGTEIPMIAILDGERIVTATDVPGIDPMRARSGAPGSMILEGNRLVVFYGTRTSRAMAAFDVVSGTRVFDVDLQASSMAPHSVSASADRIWVESGHVLDGYDAMTGAHVLRIGHGP